MTAVSLVIPPPEHGARRARAARWPAHVLRLGPRAPDGFTLVEMLIALVMFTAVSVAATTFMLKQGAAANRTNEVAAAQQGARTALDRIASDIRVVGQGLNFYDIQIPDMVVPNDGTVSVNTFQKDAISLLGIPDPADPSNQLALDPGVPGNGTPGDTQITVSNTATMTGLATGERLILFDPNTGNSQVVTLTSLSGFVLHFTGDPLIHAFPGTGTTPAVAMKLNEVRYRTRTLSGVPFLERKVNRAPWQRFVEGITLLSFEYFDAAGNAITPTTKAGRRSIQRVSIEIEAVQLRLGAVDERRARVRLATSAVPRNMLR